jgi:hypothetical protein
MSDIIVVTVPTTTTVTVPVTGLVVTTETRTGAAGVGVPSGGTAGQSLTKIDGTDYNTQWSAAGAGDMVLASVQTNSGLKTFLATTFGLRNVANTFTSLFTNVATAARTWTLQDANGTLAFLTDLPEVYTSNRESDATYQYYAMAPSGSATASSVWRVFRRHLTTQVITRADGNDNYDNIGETLSGLSYS